MSARAISFRPDPRGARRHHVAAAVVSFVALALPSSAFAASAARPATHAERSAITRALAAGDGSASAIRSVFVSRANQSLAVACERSPEAGVQAYVFGRVRGRWRYLTSGQAGRVGSAVQRRLETACG